MLAWSSEDDHLRSRVIVYHSLLGKTACISWDSLDQQFSVSHTNRRPNRTSEPNLGRYVESPCHGVPTKLGQEYAMDRVLIQQQLSRELEDGTVRSIIQTSMSYMTQLD
jgi:hypothetical protein